VRPSDRESISGDLLEEYRAARRPTLGAARANAWYVKHVVSVLWHLIRPYALVLAAQGVLLAVTVFRPGHHAPNFRPELSHTFVTMAAVQAVLYGSVMPAPGVSLFDALIYFAAAYHGVQRTRLTRTGLLAAGATSLVGFAVLFAAAAMITPGLVLAPFGSGLGLWLL
jgi:glucose-6-phosphate-specific signal transduction histidine kinase